MHLTPILCGDRSAPECDWPGTLAASRRTLAEAGRMAAEFGLWVAVENHQDFTSADLMELAISSGPNVGITLDAGNPFSVAEDPVEFARAIAPRCRHVHLKDYLAQFTDEGYRLVRCPIGDGAVPFREVLDALRPAGPLTACIEPGALSSRHIRCFTRRWWEQYPPRPASSFAAALAALRPRRIPEADDYRTPWETDCSPPLIIDYEMSQLRRSVDNLRALGLLPPPVEEKSR